jgi:hypothetical protein
MFNTTLTREYHIAAQILGLEDAAGVAELARTSIRVSFLPTRNSSRCSMKLMPSLRKTHSKPRAPGASVFPSNSGDGRRDGRARRAVDPDCEVLRTDPANCGNRAFGDEGMGPDTARTQVASYWQKRTVDTPLLQPAWHHV